jgi:hypothetical protein
MKEAIVLEFREITPFSRASGIPRVSKGATIDAGTTSLTS